MGARRRSRPQASSPEPASPPFLEYWCYQSFRPGNAFNERWVVRGILHGERIDTIHGTISIHSGLGAVGSWSSGLIHDASHSYNALLAFALMSVVPSMIPFLVVSAL